MLQAEGGGFGDALVYRYFVWLEGQGPQNPREAMAYLWQSWYWAFRQYGEKAGVVHLPASQRQLSLRLLMGRPQMFVLRRQTWLLALTVTVSVAGCYDAGAPSLILEVQIRSSYPGDVILVTQNGLTGPGSAYVYLVPPSPVAKQARPLLGSSRGQVRLFDAECHLLDERQLSAGAYDVQVQPDGSATASQFSRHLEPGPALDPLPEACGVPSNPEPTG